MRASTPTCRLLAALAATAALTLSSAAALAESEPISDDVPLVEVAAFVQARSAFQRHCHRCHSAGGEEATKKSLDRIDMGRYPFGGKRGPVAGKAIRQALGEGGGKATMPKDDPGRVQGEDLTAILRWADTFDAFHAPKEKDSTADGSPKARPAPPSSPASPPAAPPPSSAPRSAAATRGARSSAS